VRFDARVVIFGADHARHASMVAMTIIEINWPNSKRGHTRSCKRMKPFQYVWPSADEVHSNRGKV
jgi:hypothetical protein